MNIHPNDGETVPIVEESAFVDIRSVTTGHVRVRTEIDERSQTIDETLSRSDVDVTRVPVGRFVDAPPTIAERDGVTIVPVFEERLVAEKRLFLVEEIHLARRTTLTPASTTLTLRTTRAVVERD